MVEPGLRTGAVAVNIIAEIWVSFVNLCTWILILMVSDSDRKQFNRIMLSILYIIRLYMEHRDEVMMCVEYSSWSCCS